MEEEAAAEAVVVLVVVVVPVVVAVAEAEDLARLVLAGAEAALTADRKFNFTHRASYLLMHHLAVPTLDPIPSLAALLPEALALLLDSPVTDMPEVASVPSALEVVRLQLAS